MSTTSCGIIHDDRQWRRLDDVIKKVFLKLLWPDRGDRPECSFLLDNYVVWDGLFFNINKGCMKKSNF